jgi:dienelactone hydrolase
MGFAVVLLSMDMDAQEISLILPSMRAEQWPARRLAILEGMQQVMGHLPDRTQLPDVSCQVVAEVDSDPEVLIQSIRFQSREDQWVPAYLLLPRKPRVHPSPAVLCLHQTTPFGKGEPAGFAGNVHLHYGLELTRRGFIALVPDYPSFGDYVCDFAEDSPWQSGTLRAVWDNMRGIDWLTQREDVDAAQIGCIGHSLGGHNAIFTSVFDQRITAVVSSCGFTRFHTYYSGNLKGWTSARYMPRIATVYHSDPDRMPFDFPELVAAIAPRAFFTSSPQGDDNFDCDGVRESIDGASKIFQLLGVPDQLVAIYPDCGHDFPPASREAAYRFLEARLMPTSDASSSDLPFSAPASMP